MPPQSKLKMDHTWGAGEEGQDESKDSFRKKKERLDHLCHLVVLQKRRRPALFATSAVGD